jgi:hypothetical protein
LFGFKVAHEYFESKSYLFQFPDASSIKAHCAHFVASSDVDEFCDLVVRLFAGPQAPQKAVGFAEHLVRTHNFFQPLRVEVHARQVQEHDGDLTSLGPMLGGVDQSPNSRFQRLVAALETLLQPSNFLSSIQTCKLVQEISQDIAVSSMEEVSEKLRCDVVEVLMKALQAHKHKFAIARVVLGSVLQVPEMFPNQRHLLMHLTHAGHETKESVLEYLVKLVTSSFAWLDEEDPEIMASAPELQARALKCIAQIVSCSISYHSLSDFSTSGCYGSPKMRSLLTANVLACILRALGCKLPALHGSELGRVVVKTLFEDSLEAASFFVEIRSALRDMIRRDETVQEFCRLFAIDAPAL